MQSVSIDHVDRKILDLLQTESGINASAIGERIGLSQSACWRRIQRLREEGVIQDRPVVLDREKVGLTTMVFAHVKLTSHGRSNLSAFADAVKSYPEVMDCYVLLGNVDFLLRIVAADIKAYEQFFFEKLSQLPGIQEVTSSIVLSDTKHTSAADLGVWVSAHRFAIQRSTCWRSAGNGIVPFSRIRSWNSRISNASPKASSARLRNARISRPPES